MQIRIHTIQLYLPFRFEPRATLLQSSAIYKVHDDAPFAFGRFSREKPQTQNCSNGVVTAIGLSTRWEYALCFRLLSRHSWALSGIKLRCLCNMHGVRTLASIHILKKIINSNFENNGANKKINSEFEAVELIPDTLRTNGRMRCGERSRQLAFRIPHWQRRQPISICIRHTGSSPFRSIWHSFCLIFLTAFTINYLFTNREPTVHLRRRAL